MKTILVAIDLSAATVKVCSVARDLARLMGARLRILHVVPPIPASMGYYDFFDAHATPLARAAAKRAATKLRALEHWFRKSCPDAHAVQCAGEPVAHILRCVARLKPSIVVLGSHGHTAAFELLMGSVAHGVLRRSPVPVLLVPIRAAAKPRRPSRFVIASDARVATR